MLYVQSAPWLFKLSLIAINFLHKPSEKPAAVSWNLRVYCGVCVYVLASLLPSVFCSVRDRNLTTEYCCLTVIMAVDVYVLACVMLHERSAAHHLCLMLQFACLHMLVSQISHLRRKAHVMLFSEMYKYMHAGVLMLSIVALNQHATAVQTTRQDLVLVFACLFVGELLGCCAYMQYVVSRVLGDVYESVMNSIFTF